MAVHQPTPVQQRVLSVLVENRSGVLSHVVGLFSARGFNIDSLAVGETEDATMSRITLVVKSDAKTFEQIKKQLNKLIDVIKVQDLTDEEFVDKELMLVKFKADEATEKALSDLCKRYRMSIVERGESVIVVESTESHDKTRELFELFRKIGIAEIARTGVVALSKKPVKN